MSSPQALYCKYTRCAMIEAMAKKKHKKKHNFQHKGVTQSAVAATSVPAAVNTKGASKTATMPNEWSEVAGDVRRALILAGVFIVIMIALWYFLDVSEFGKNLYNSIKF